MSVLLHYHCVFTKQDGPHEYDYIDENDSTKKGRGTMGGHTSAPPPAQADEYSEIPDQFETPPHGHSHQAVPSHPTRQKSNRAQPKPRPHKYINTHGHTHSVFKQQPNPIASEYQDIPPEFSLPPSNRPNTTGTSVCLSDN